MEMKAKMSDTDAFDGVAIDEEIRCITDHPGFIAVCLNRHTLDIAYSQYKQQYGSSNMERTHKKYRYTAYRQIIRWCWGYLGKHIRQPLPSCVVQRIRDRFNNDNETITGFQYYTPEWMD